MQKAGSDPKVKKTLVRNIEHKTRKEREQVIHDVDASSSNMFTKNSHTKENELDHPILCSSEALAKYLVDTKKSLSPLSPEDLNVDKGKLSAKMTKKLNFHFNDKIFKNLVELNAEVASTKNKKEKKPTRPNSIKKDLEPKIEDFDFSDNEDDIETSPNIPIVRPKFKPVRQFEDGHLHRLVASFEVL